MASSRTHCVAGGICHPRNFIDELLLIGGATLVAQVAAVILTCVLKKVIASHFGELPVIVPVLAAGRCTAAKATAAPLAQLALPALPSPSHLAAKQARGVHFPVTSVKEQRPQVAPVIVTSDMLAQPTNMPSHSWSLLGGSIKCRPRRIASMALQPPPEVILPLWHSSSLGAANPKFARAGDMPALPFTSASWVRDLARQEVDKANVELMAGHGSAQKDHLSPARCLRLGSW